MDGVSLYMTTTSCIRVSDTINREGACGVSNELFNEPRCESHAHTGRQKWGNIVITPCWLRRLRRMLYN